ncbi:MAG: AbrB/MazE/SpoVT family DNA-binding domain-containing protein [Akkermansiaceae bacterium]|jgi:AbrB family looped-hinge helix DNA binding protein|nr:AbrB/MazE/SpoVT family DNA-binding domain-containing protein [Akkermansiaceae bacterium]
MTTSLLSPKFQIVIPKEIRRSLALTPGQRIAFVEKDGIVTIRPVLKPEQLIGLLKASQPIEFEREPDREL